MPELVYRTVTADLAVACEEMELMAFPDSNPEDLFDRTVVEAYAEVFPEGFFVCMDGDKVVGQSAGILVDFDFEHPEHRLVDLLGEDQCRNHDPDGDWYYGSDIVVHPEYRRLGIGQRLYDLRKELVLRKGKRGIIAGGYPRGYKDYYPDMHIDDYLEKVRTGEIYDPTLTFQMGNGFEIVCALPDYIRDPENGDYAALIRWEAPA